MYIDKSTIPKKSKCIIIWALHQIFETRNNFSSTSLSPVLSSSQQQCCNQSLTHTHTCIMYGCCWCIGSDVSLVWAASVCGDVSLLMWWCGGGVVWLCILIWADVSFSLLTLNIAAPPPGDNLIKHHRNFEWREKIHGKHFWRDLDFIGRKKYHAAKW